MTCFDVFLLLELLHGLLPLFFLLSQLSSLLYNLFAIIMMLCTQRRRRRLHLVFLCRLDCLESVQEDVKGFVLLLLVPHFNTRRRRLNQLIQCLDLPIIHAAARYERLQRLHVSGVLHYGRPVGISAGRVHLLEVGRSGV